MIRNLIQKLRNNQVKIYQLESLLLSKSKSKSNSKNTLVPSGADFEKIVKIRRKWYEKTSEISINKLPFENYNYSQLLNKNCENVIGYTRVPVGLVGPLLINGQEYHVPIATTEGSLVSSLNRGAKAIKHNNCAGIETIVIERGMTRAPIFQFQNLNQLRKFLYWIEHVETTDKLQRIFNRTSRYGMLSEKLTSHVAGDTVHIRFQAHTGDAMGMNIITKGVEEIVKYILKVFPGSVCLSVSGNLCTDKKPSAVDWILGRGRMVVAETSISESILEEVLHTDIDRLINLNIEKNLVGTALAGSIGGNNAHMANIVAGIYLATGQDLAQIGTSSVGLTKYSRNKSTGELKISVTMPSLELGTVGGGTNLEDQEASLEILGINNKEEEDDEYCKEISGLKRPGERADKLASMVAATCLVGELSLMSALSTGELMKAHLKLNR